MDKATLVGIVRVLYSRRFNLTDEIATHLEIGLALRDAKIEYEREVRLSPACRIDFLIGDVGLEVKIKGSRRQIFRQCERYCQIDRIAALILATNVASGFPAEIAGKPVVLVNLGRAWL